MHKSPISPKRSIRPVALLVTAAVLILVGVFNWPGMVEWPSPPGISSQISPPTFQGRGAGYWLDQVSASDRSTRRDALHTLSSARLEAIPVLGYLLRSDSQQVRSQAEQVLSAMGVEAVPGIIELLKDQHPNARRHAARILATVHPDLVQLDTENAVQALIVALDDREAMVALDAAYALVNYRQHAAPAVDALLNAMQHDQALIRTTAAVALAAIGPEASPAIPQLIHSLDDSDTGVRRAAAQAIGRIGPPAALAAMDQLIALLASDEIYVRMAAATALGQLGPPASDALPALRNLRDDPAAQAQVVWAIAKITGEPIDSQLDSQLQDINVPEISRSAEAGASADSSYPTVSSHNWPMLAGRLDRNAVTTTQLPTDWDLQGGTNVLWEVPLGQTTFASPAVADGRVFIGTDNSRKRNPEQTSPQGVLVALSAEDGTLLWQDEAPYIEDRGLYWTLQPYTTSTPLVEGDRLYYITSQAQIRCLDVEGFADGENDGPRVDEGATGPHHADLVWEVDMGTQLGVYPHEAPNGSIVSVGDLLMVSTSNGVDESHTDIPAPRAPSFIGVNKHTGEIVWKVIGPSPRLLHGQWSSPSLGQVDGRTIAFFGGGDGWLYALHADSGRELWRYDGNPKAAKWRPASDTAKVVSRNNIIACPVFHQGSILLAMGQDPTHGNGQGVLHKIHCQGRGDVTTSHAVWQNHDVHRTVASPIVDEGLVYVGDTYGQVHCIDLETGKQLWMHDQMAAIWGCMLIAGDALYVGDEDGLLTIYRTGRKKQILNELQLPRALYAMPAVAGNTLFLATASRLYALRHEAVK